MEQFLCHRTTFKKVRYVTLILYLVFVLISKENTYVVYPRGLGSPKKRHLLLQNSDELFRQ